MEFKTEIVRTWEPGKSVKIVALFAILLGGYFLFISEEDLGPVLKVIVGLFYFVGIFLGIGQPFLKPKKIGNLKVDSPGISVDSPNVQKEFSLAEIKDITLKYSGYGSWWSHTFYGNKNYVLLKTQEDELLELEILIKDKEHKKVLKQLLSEGLVGVSFSSVKIGAAEF